MGNRKMIPKHQAIFNAYPNVKSVIGDIAYDENDNIVEIDETLLTDLDVLITEAKLKGLRNVRNQKLAETDWMSNVDVTMSEEWRIYRQALRDITNTYTSLDDVVWPTPPA